MCHGKHNPVEYEESPSSTGQSYVLWYHINGSLLFYTWFWNLDANTVRTLSGQRNQTRKKHCTRFSVKEHRWTQP
ncbi:hypothetical protein BJX66DRAFT_315557 [Aspergillus keveii]|uniref:Uncharacterized protein n=1 Tax=Aspergillus keveii TaxID=714993 RepID=A0ABR4FQ09_9EURO